ncbi:Nucleic acid-binding, OB-fold [Sesbania bispinosa]|nr:Nucleic acid-binding, OB-fold [Sesbania bispinosa]
MVLVDYEGGGIQASIRKAMMKKISNCVTEGFVYKMTYFTVIANGGTYRATTHEFKLLFQPRTKVVPAESEIIPRFGLDVKSSKDIQDTNGKSDYLFDFTGLLTGVSEDKLYERNDKTTRVLELELTEDKGVVKCSLYGHFIDTMKGFMLTNADELSVVVIQFAKVKRYMGKVSLYTVGNSTRLLWNPEIPEVRDFKNSIACHGIDMHGPLRMIGDLSFSMTDEFLSYFTRKTEGNFIFLATVDAIVKYSFWWCSCKCYKYVKLDEGTNTYYCTGCKTHVSEVIPRYKLKLEVNDGIEKANFVLSRNHLMNIQELNKLIGNGYLIKVEVKDDRAFRFDDSFKVKRVCQDKEIIRGFKDDALIKTPEMFKLKEPVVQDLDDGVLGGESENVDKCAGLAELYNDHEFRSSSLGESSNASACLPPQKRKNQSRATALALSKKRGIPKTIKIEKD